MKRFLSILPLIGLSLFLLGQVRPRSVTVKPSSWEEIEALVDEH